MSLTTDKNDPNLNKIKSSGQQESYLILSDEERAKGFVRPVRTAYVHTGIKIIGEISILSKKDKERYKKWNYYAYEEYPVTESPLVGRHMTEADYNTIKNGHYKGCNTTTTMARELAETIARDPKFYGATFCIHCKTHKSMEEFQWKDGSIMGS